MWYELVYEKLYLNTLVFFSNHVLSNWNPDIYYSYDTFIILYS